MVCQDHHFQILLEKYLLNYKTVSILYVEEDKRLSNMIDCTAQIRIQNSKWMGMER